MWPFDKRKQHERIERQAAAEAILQEDDKSEILMRAGNDVVRRSLCLQWAGQARTAWYRGRREAIAYVVASDHARYRPFPIEVRKSIGEQLWSRSVEQKDLASLEQMYTRWAQSFSGTVEEGNYSGVQGSVRRG